MPSASLPSYDEVKAALRKVVKEKNGGFSLQMWATVVDRDGIVKLVVFSGNDRGDQWPGSRSISAQKANTANAFSLPGLALSTANLFTATQPGQSLYGLQHSNPVSTYAAYRGDPACIGTVGDPMVGRKIGGVNVFGGGLALYEATGNGPLLLGAIGVSGDTSCADHNVAWRTRDALALDFVPAGLSGPDGDNIIFDFAPTNPGQSGFEHFVSASGFGHPVCLADDDIDDNAAVVADHPLN